MRYAIAPIALAAVAAAVAVPQGVTEDITPSTSAPAGCSGDYPGTFQIQVVNVTTPAKQKRQGGGALILTLSGGVLKDAQGRTGYIAANRQFQFDGPAQTGAIYTAGWSVCQNNTLAIGNDVVFQQCLSGTFYNLYDEATEEQCTPIYIEAINAGGAASGAASVMPDGQPTASPQPVNQIGDGQPQASTGAVTQIGDGQIQAPTGTPVMEMSDGQITAATGAPVTQIGDGQIQAPTTTGAPVTQIGDGQIQAPTAAATSSGYVVSQIPDGQIQAPTNATKVSATPSVMPYTGAATIPTMRSELFGLAAGVLAIAML
ncbi:uncharacterized protein SEPMUDRAFT_146491 [Sphaerulina musiva SO2202]|uniref:Cell wall mannoprotein PIR1-like C-terminal domain-containing protein n=1 Tax=Sphaerulina musiva (strain SO2202) TaxID=692275 RepID=N1QNP9_SPHMS|nr:uncharacterized protein SEPMUDRAFT_146491 [Sphaerulina musiva SO2202]EMF17469.1 hypothetical protein SEPMUDRAFT_146491 [Sphaerulina musiva SO2202]